MSNLGSMISQTATGSAANTAYQQGLESQRYAQQTPILNRQQEAKTGIDEQTLAETKLNAAQGILGGIKDQAGWDAGLHLADQMGILPKGYSQENATFDPQKIAAMNNTLQAHKANAVAQTASTEALGKGSIQAAQQLAAAAASGNQDVYTKTKAQLANAGIDVSNFADDIATGGKQATSLASYQQPLGQLLNAGAKMDANNIAARTAAGESTPNPNAIATNILVNRSLVGTPTQATQQPIPQTNTAQPTVAPQSISPSQQMQPVNNVPTAVQTQEQPKIIGTFGGSKVISTTSGMPVAITAQGMPQFVPPPRDPNITQTAYQQKFEQALQAYKSDPQVLAANKEAETMAGKVGDTVADASKTFNVMQSNLPLVLQRFKNMREAAQNASYGLGVDENGNGFYTKLAGSDLGNNTTSAANTVLKQYEAQGILPELAPQLNGIKANKFLEGIANNASGIDLSAKPQDKIKAIDGLNNQYINMMKSNANQLRLNGQPAPTDIEIDDYVKQLNNQGKTNSAAQSYPPAETFKSASEPVNVSDAHTIANQYTPAQLKAALDKKRAARNK